jgi:cyclophilin family peptidyl-prolyl cis-trans isomerase
VFVGEETVVQLHENRKAHAIAAQLWLACVLSLVSAQGWAVDTSTAGSSAPRVLIETSMGNITIELDPTHSPKTVENFLRYVAEHHFDGTVVYRVAPGFVIQAGSYDADGNYRAVHEPVPLEANNGLTNQRGSVAMARQDDPNSATAEFFIDLANNANLDRRADDTTNTTGYAVFGRVVEGMDVADRIASVPIGGKGPMPAEAPVSPITISRVVELP